MTTSVRRESNTMPPRRRPARRRPAVRNDHGLWKESNMWQKGGALVITIGAAIGVLYTGGVWMAGKVVWAAQYEQTVADQNCRFDRLERTQLEGQLADAGYRISSFQSRKQLTPDDARELATLHVREEIVKQRLKEIGTECESQSKRPASKK